MSALRVIVGISGASGAIYGVRLLEALSQAPAVESHLVLSQWGARTVEHETGLSVADVQELADVVHAPGNQASPLSSGSFRTAGMIVAPCSMRTLAAIASGLSYNLLTRAADVVLKERRRLVLLAREAPLTEVHLQNMLTATRMGAIVLPPVPGFYSRPQTVAEIVDHTVGRTLDLFGLAPDALWRWDGHLDRPRMADPEAAASG